MQEELVQSNDASGSAEAGGIQDPAQRMESMPDPQPVMQDSSSHTGRKIVVSLLVIFGMLLLFVANLAFWARFTLLNTNGWVNAVGPLTQDQQIADIIGIYVAEEIFDAMDIDQAVTGMLPADFQLLSAPLSIAMERLVEDAVSAFVQSNLVNAVWVNTNRAAHNLIVGVLRGEGDVLYLERGELVVDASPVVDLVENTFGLEDLGIDLAEDAGRIVLLENQQVAYLQQAVSYLDTLGILLPVITLVVLIVAVLVSLWRRSTFLWIGVGIIVTMVISLIAYEVSESWFLVSITDPLLRLIGGRIWNAVINGLITQTIVLIVLGVLIVIGAWIAGPSRSAVGIRSTVQGWTDRSE